MGKLICFFSSDARPLYKRDVFRALSYPDGFVIHFRYTPNHVDVDYSASIKGKSGAIFLTSGNDLKKPEDQRQINNIFIRDVTVVDAYHEDDTDLVHFYLQLGAFKDSKLDVNLASKLPAKFVAEHDVANGNIIQWHQVIKLIKGSFPNELFYKFKINNIENDDNLPIHYDASERQSFYQLTDETTFKLDMAFFDTESSSSNDYHSMRIKSMNDQLLNVSSPDLIKIEGRYDNRTFTVLTKSISSSTIFTYLHFETVTETTTPSSQPSVSPQVDTVLKIKVEKNKWRVARFGGWSIVAAISFGYAKLISDKIDLNGSFDWAIAVHLVIAAGLGYLSAFKLYNLFDKK